MIISKFEEIFPYEKFPVEYKCYQQFLINPSPIDGINYLAIPWTQILNSSWLNFPNKKSTDYYFNELNKIPPLQGRSVTVCQHDDYLMLLPFFQHLNIHTVFSPLHNKTNAQTLGIHIKPIAFTCAFEFIERPKDIHFSFVGTPTSHHIRQRMSERIHGEGIIYRGEYHVDSQFFFVENYKSDKEKEYQEVLERSRFSLCPRGSSPSSVRFWESLSAGAIPILISDNWVLPEWDWKNTIVQISEDAFEKLDYEGIRGILSSISEEKETEMRQNCKLAYEKFNQNNYQKYILENL
jgi:hypothetical protein